MLDKETLEQTEDIITDYLPEDQYSGSETTASGEITPAKLIHKTIDFKPEGMLVGFTFPVERENGIDNQHLVVINDGRIYCTPAATKVSLGDTPYVFDRTGMPPSLAERWEMEKITDFVRDPACHQGPFESLKTVLERFLEFSSPAQYELVAVWTIATYFCHQFPAFPYLLFFGPKEAGKSKTLELMCLVAFNPVKVKHISEAALCDTTSGSRGTVLYDQAESMPAHMAGILADSYKRVGGKRRIIRMKKGERVVQEYSGYGPKAFGTTRALDIDLRDRCCQINMQRSSQPLPDLIGNEPEWAELRDQCYRFLITRWRDVEDAFSAIPATGTRKGELWRPLEAVLRVLGVSEEDIRGIKEAFDYGTDQTKNQLSAAEEALFQVVLDRTERSRVIELTAAEILNEMKPLLDSGDYPSPQELGRIIAPYCLASRSRRRTRNKLMHYTFEGERARGIIARYMRIDETEEQAPRGPEVQEAEEA
jgi:hypothetical protein